jgi:hypothetical protein
MCGLRFLTLYKVYNARRVERSHHWPMFRQKGLGLRGGGRVYMEGWSSRQTPLAKEISRRLWLNDKIKVSLPAVSGTRNRPIFRSIFVDMLWTKNQNIQVLYALAP